MLKKALIIAQDLEYKRRPEQVSWFCILKLLKEQGLKVYVIVPCSKSRFDPERYSSFVKELKKVSDGFYIYSKKKYFFHPFILFISFRNSFTKEDVSFSTDDPRKFAELCIEALKNKLDFQPLFKKFEEIYNVEKNFSKVIDKIKKMKKAM